MFLLFYAHEVDGLLDGSLLVLAVLLAVGPGQLLGVAFLQSTIIYYYIL